MTNGYKDQKMMSLALRMQFHLHALGCRSSLLNGASFPIMMNDSIYTATIGWFM